MFIFFSSNKHKKAIVILSWYSDKKKKALLNRREERTLLTMSDEILPDSSTETKISDEQEDIPSKSEEKSATSIVAELDDVQLFCAEFHIKVENAVGIRPWLQFSETNFPGKMPMLTFSIRKSKSLFVEEVLKQFEESEFDMPTPIQSIAWPILGQNRDLVGIASTGSGKTLAVIIQKRISLSLSILSLVSSSPSIPHS